MFIWLGSSLLREAFSSCSEWELLFLAVCGLLLVVASPVAEHRLEGVQTSIVVARGLSSCGSWALKHKLSSGVAQAQLPYSMWDLRRSRIEPVSPALAGGLFTTKPPGKPRSFNYKGIRFCVFLLWSLNNFFFFLCL